MNHSKTTLRVVLQHLMMLLVCIILGCIPAKAATVYFNKVFQGAGSNYTEKDRRLNNISLLPGTGFRFTSSNPDAPEFQYVSGGNNISGTLTYVNSSGVVIHINGIISGQDKANGATHGFCFINPAAGTAYLLVIPTYESRYSAGTAVQTSSDGNFLTDLNRTLSTQQSFPKLTIANTSAIENAGHMVFTVVINPAATSGFSFTPTVNPGTASATADYTASMEYNTGDGWLRVAGPIQLQASVTSLQIRVPIINDLVIEPNETFTLNTGIITGGGFLNNEGTFAEATIIDNDGTPAPIAQEDVTYTYGDPVFSLAPQSANTSGGYSYEITGPGGVVTQQSGRFTITGVGTTQVTIYQAPGGGYGQGTKVVNITVTPAALTITALSQTKTYDGIPYSGGNGVSYSGLVYNETPAVLTGMLTYGGTAQNAVNTGSYVINAGGLSSGNYTITYVDGALHITRAALTITAIDAVKTYDGIAYNGGNGVSYLGFVNGETAAVLQGTLRYDGTAQGAVNAGTYTIIPDGQTAANYTLTYIGGELFVGKAPLMVRVASASKPYDGISYSGGNGIRYTGFVNGETAALITGTLVYGGTAQNAVHAGIYSLTAGGLSAANYVLSYVDGTLTISAVPLTITVVSHSKTYDGIAYSGGNGVSYSGFVNGETASVLGGTLGYGGAAQGAKNVGSYVLTAGGYTSVDYTISYTAGMLAITRAPLMVVANDVAKLYDGRVMPATGYTLSYSGFMPGDDAANALSGVAAFGGAAQMATAVGTYTIEPGGLASANYTISYTNGTLTIHPAVLTITAIAQSKVYDGQLYSGGNGVTYSGFTGGDNASNALAGSVTYGGSWHTARAAGTYTIVPGGVTAANYTITFRDADLVISPATLTATIADDSKAYDGQSYSGGKGISFSGFVNGETAALVSGTLAYGGTAQGATNAGVYTLDGSGLAAPNYHIHFVAGSLTITPVPLQVQVQGVAKTYDGIAYSGGNGVSYSGFVNGETASVLGGTLGYGGAAQGARNVGSYVLTANGLSSSNYTISYTPGQLTINPAALTATLSNQVKTYDGQPYGGGNGISYTGFAAGENASVLNGTIVYGDTAQGARNVGTYTLSASGLSADNYTISYTGGTLTIVPAPLTVRAVAKSKVYDGRVYGGSHGVDYDGFVNSETAAVLGGSLSFGGNWQGATQVGDYTIVPGGLTAANYHISYTGGTLSITPAVLRAVVASKTKTYDGQVYGGGYSLSVEGFVNNETYQGVVTGTPEYGGGALAAINAGTYVITASGLSAVNYTFIYSDGTLTINKAALVVKASDAVKTYDGQRFAGGNGITITGFAGGDNAAVLGGNIQYGGSAQGASASGSYTLSAGGFTSVNYTISYVPGMLTINPALLTVRVADTVKTYDGRSWQGGSGLIYSGLVAGETESVVGGQPVFGGTAQGARNVGRYTLSVSGLQAANYVLAYESGTLAIKPATLSVGVQDVAKVYDGRPFDGNPMVSYTGWVPGESPALLTGTLIYSGNWRQAVNAGHYEIAASGLSAPNYTLVFLPGKLTITRAPLRVTAGNKSKVYDGQPFDLSAHTVSYQGFVGNDDQRVLAGNLVFGGSAANARNAGNYIIMPGGLTAANYEPVFTAGSLTIAKAPLVVKADTQSKTYDGKPFPVSAYTVSYKGLVAGESGAQVLGGTPAFAGSAVAAVDAGTYAILPAGLRAANYEISYVEGVLTIHKADPVLVIPDLVKTYGDPDFKLPLAQSTSTGKISLSLQSAGVAALSGDVVSIQGVGVTQLTATQAPDRNYNGASARATITVRPALLTVLANPAFRCVGDDNPSLTYTIKGFVNRENATVLTAMPQLQTSATPQSPAGTYPIMVSGAEAANYEFRYVPASIKVNNPVRRPVELPLVAVIAGERGELAARPFGIKYEWLPVTGLSAPASATTQVRVQQDQEYTVRITEPTGCVIVDRVKVRVFEQAGTYVPNAFSPNGDGKNDLLRVIGPGLEKLHYFRVFNRFGQMLFETTEPGKGWDGTFKGAPQPEDTYVWVLVAEKKGGGKLEDKGFVLVVR